MRRGYTRLFRLFVEYYSQHFVIPHLIYVISRVIYSYRGYINYGQHDLVPTP
jgi:hypothetical protein